MHLLYVIKAAVGQDAKRVLIRMRALMLAHARHVLIEIASDEHNNAVVCLQAVDELVAVHDV